MGNEASQQSLSYGEKLENDVIVNWERLKCDNPFPGRDGHCSCAVKNDLYVFGGVLQSDDSECVESNELLIFNTGKGISIFCDLICCQHRKQLQWELVKIFSNRNRRKYFFSNLQTAVVFF